MAKYRQYTVYGGAKGYVIVDVPLGALSIGDEREVVAKYAFDKLMGRDVFGRDTNKNLRTREIIQTEINSRYERHRGNVYDTFVNKIKFRPVRNVNR